MNHCRPADETSDATDFEELPSRIDKPLGVAYMVGRLDRALNRHFRQALAPLGVTIGQYTALSVFCSSGRLSNAKLAERTMVSPQAANELIKVMEKNGWIERRPDPDHGRIIQISLTKEGMRLLSRCNKVISALERQMLHELSDNQIVSLRQQLRNAVGVLREL